MPSPYDELLDATPDAAPQPSPQPAQAPQPPARTVYDDLLDAAPAAKAAGTAPANPAPSSAPSPARTVYDDLLDATPAAKSQPSTTPDYPPLPADLRDQAPNWKPGDELSGTSYDTDEQERNAEQYNNQLYDVLKQRGETLVSGHATPGAANPAPNPLDIARQKADTTQQTANALTEQVRQSSAELDKLSLPLGLRNMPLRGDAYRALANVDVFPVGANPADIDAYNARVKAHNNLVKQQQAAVAGSKSAADAYNGMARQANAPQVLAGYDQVAGMPGGVPPGAPSAPLAPGLATPQPTGSVARQAPQVYAWAYGRNVAPRDFVIQALRYPDNPYHNEALITAHQHPEATAYLGIPGDLIAAARAQAVQPQPLAGALFPKQYPEAQIQTRMPPTGPSFITPVPYKAPQEDLSALQAWGRDISTEAQGGLLAKVESPLTGTMRAIGRENPEIGDAGRDLRNILLGPAYGVPLKSSGAAEDVINELLRGSAYFSTPEGVAMAFTGAGLGDALPELSRNPQFVEWLKDVAPAQYPKIAKAVELVAAHAVPATFSTMLSAGGVGNIAQGMAQGDIGKVGAGLAYLGMGVAGFGHIASDAPEMAGSYPPNAEVTPEQAAAAQGVGGIARAPRVDPELAERTAQALEAQGRPLAAEAWRSAARADNAVPSGVMWRRGYDPEVARAQFQHALDVAQARLDVTAQSHPGDPVLKQQRAEVDRLTRALGDIPESGAVATREPGPVVVMGPTGEGRLMRVFDPGGNPVFTGSESQFGGWASRNLDSSPTPVHVAGVPPGGPTLYVRSGEPGSGITTPAAIEQTIPELQEPYRTESEQESEYLQQKKSETWQAYRAADRAGDPQATAVARAEFDRLNNRLQQFQADQSARQADQLRQAMLAAHPTMFAEQPGQPSDFSLRMRQIEAQRQQALSQWAAARERGDLPGMLGALALHATYQHQAESEVQKLAEGTPVAAPGNPATRSTHPIPEWDQAAPQPATPLPVTPQSTSTASNNPPPSQNASEFVTHPFDALNDQQRRALGHQALVAAGIENTTDEEKDQAAREIAAQLAARPEASRQILQNYDIADLYDRMTGAQAVPPSAAALPAQGWYAPRKVGVSTEEADAQSAGLPAGHFYSLDRPFESDQHEAATQVDLPKVERTYDPDGLLGKPSPRLDIGPTVTEQLQSLPEDAPYPQIVHAERQAIAGALREAGYDSYVRGIDGNRSDRELIVLQGAQVQAAQPESQKARKPEAVRSSAAVQRDLDNFQPLPGETPLQTVARKTALTAEYMKATTADLSSEESLAEAAARIAQRKEGEQPPPPGEEKSEAEPVVHIGDRIEYASAKEPGRMATGNVTALLKPEAGGTLTRMEVRIDPDTTKTRQAGMDLIHFDQLRSINGVPVQPAAPAPQPTQPTPPPADESAFDKTYREETAKFSAEREKKYPAAELLRDWNTLKTTGKASVKDTSNTAPLAGLSEIVTKSHVEGRGRKRRTVDAYEVHTSTGRTYSYEWEGGNNDWAGAKALAQARGLYEAHNTLHGAMLSNGDYVGTYEKQYALRQALMAALPGVTIPDISTVVTDIPEHPTFEFAKEAIARSLPRNLGDLDYSYSWGFSPEQTKQFDDKLAHYQKEADEAAAIVGADNPRVVELRKLIEDTRAKYEAKRAEQEQKDTAAREANRKAVESDARKDAAYYARFGTTQDATGDETVLPDLWKYGRLANWPEAADGRQPGSGRAVNERALREFGIEKNQLQPLDLSGRKLTKGDLNILRDVKLSPDGSYIPGRMSDKQEEEWKARGWLDAQGIKLTEMGERAALGQRESDTLDEAGRPMADYRPGSGNIPEPEKSRFGLTAPVPYKGENWHTQGNFATLGDPPKNWTPPAAGETHTVPDLARVIPAEKGESTWPVGFWAGNNGTRFLAFSNGGAMDASFFDHINKLHEPDQWTAQNPDKAFQAWKGKKLIGVVMPVRKDIVPPKLQEMVKQANRKPAGIPEKARQIWDAMNASERAGVPHGLFPADKMRAAEAEGYKGRDITLALMAIAGEPGNQPTKATAPKNAPKKVTGGLKKPTPAPVTPSSTPATPSAPAPELTPEQKAAETAGNAAVDRLRDRLKNRRGKEEPPAFSRSLFEEPESGPHGPITREFYHDPAGAIAWLKEHQGGEAAAALYHPEIGDIDLIWGDENKGIAKLIALHREKLLDELPEFFPKMKVDAARSGPNRKILYDDKRKAVVRLDFDGIAKKWLFTAYYLRGEQPPSTGRTTDIPGSRPGEGRTDTAPPSEGGNSTSTLAPRPPKVKPDEGPAFSRESVTQNQAEYKQDLIDLGFRGTQHMVTGKLTTYEPWAQQMLSDIGDILRAVAEDSGQTTDKLLRLVYRYAAAGATRYGVQEAPAEDESPAFARALKTSPEMFRRVGERTNYGGEGYWVDRGKVIANGTSLHAQMFENAQPGTLFGDVVRGKLREGAVRVRGANIELYASALEGKNLPLAIERAVAEAHRQHLPEISMEVHPASGTPQFLSVPLSKVGDLLADPQWYVRENRPAFARALPGFYSQLERVVDQKVKGPQSPQQLLAMLRNPQNGVKADELKWSGLETWLEGRKAPVTPTELQEFLKQNQVQVQETVRGKHVDHARVAELQAELAKAIEEAKSDKATPFKEGDRVATDGNAPSIGGYRYTEGRVYEAQRNKQGLLVWKKVGTFGGTRAGRSDKFVRELKAEAQYPWLDAVGNNGAVSDSLATLVARNRIAQIESALETAKQGTGAPTKFQKWKTPGGQNYRELLLTLPERPSEWQRAQSEIRQRHGRQLPQGHPELTPEESQRLENAQGTTVPPYHSPHWSEPNVLAHIRFTDRTGPNREKILHVEEIQSDWHQQGKKKGYREAGIADKVRESDLHARDLQRRRDAATGEEHDRLVRELTAALNAHRELQIRAARGIPPAPFAKTWHELAFRRALRYAAENGYDAVTWNTGQQQADRYDLSKEVDSVHYSPEQKRLWAVKDGQDVIKQTGVEPGDVEDYVGKEIAQKLNSGAIDEGTHDRRTVSGKGLKVGGEGMKGFYDQILPAYANKYGKKWGASVGTMKLKGIQEPLHSLPITPAMRESVMEQGQPLFSRGDYSKQTGPIQAEFRPAKGPNPAAVYANRAGVQALAAVWGETGPMAGVFLTEAQAAKAIDTLQDTAPELARAIADGRLGQGVLVASAEAPVSKILTALRHEGWHGFQNVLAPNRPRRHLGTQEDRFLNHPLAVKAQPFLRTRGYSPDDMAMEIGSHLVAGQNAEIGLTHDEGVELLSHYFDLIAEEHGAQALQQATNVAPMFKKVLDAAQQRAERQGAKGPNRTSVPGAPKGPGGLPQSLREGVPARGSAGTPTPARGPADLHLREGSEVAPGYIRDATGFKDLAQTEIVPALKSGTRLGTQVWDSILKTFAPQKRGADAYRAYLLLRERGGEMKQRQERAESAMDGLKTYFLGQPAEYGVHGLGVIDAMESGEFTGLAGNDLKFAQTAHKLLLDREAEIKRLGLLKHYLENYFPHAWKDADEATRWVQNWQTKKPLAGREAYRKKRSIPTMRDGLEDPEFKLQPRFDNPVDFLLDKLAEMDKSITAHDAFEEWNGQHWFGKAPSEPGEPAPNKVLKFIHIFDDKTDKTGLGQIDDRIFTVYGPPTVKIQEAYDADLMQRLERLAKSLGITHIRKPHIGGTRLGYTSEYGPIVTKFGGPESVLIHELGHQLQFKYNILQLLKDRAYPERTKELRALADLRYEGHPDVAESFKRYVRNKDEKAANAIAALLYAPEKFKEAAPNTWDFLRDELWHIPALRPLFEARRSLTLDSRSAEVPVGGMVTVGHWYAPKPMADLINNNLKPGIRGLPGAQVVHYVNRLLNMFELGMSFFHAMTTTLNSQVSDIALAIEQAESGRPLKSLAAAARGVVPFASVVNDVVLGSKLRKAVLTGKAEDPISAAFADTLKIAGGQATADTFWTTAYLRSMIRQWQTQHGPAAVVAAGVHLPFVVVEQTIRPVMQWLVPRVKLAAFFRLAENELARNPDMTPEQARDAFGKAWDSIDNRFGQLSQRNLMMNQTVKDAMNIVVGRPGWNIGTVREMGGGAFDLLAAAARLVAEPQGSTTPIGGGPGGSPPQISGGAAPPIGGPNPAVLSHRAAFLLASFVGLILIDTAIQVAMTGELPKDERDLLAPRVGGTDAEGNPNRIVVPLYLSRDVYQYATRGLDAVLGKLSPALQLATQLIRNRDSQSKKVYGEGGYGLPRYLLGEHTPYSVSGLMQNRENNASPGRQALPFVGIMPAPRRMGMTEAQKAISDYTYEHRSAVRLENEIADAKSKLADAFRAGDMDRAARLATQFDQGGLLNEKDVEKAYQDAQVPHWILSYKTIPADSAVQIFEKMTPAEQDKVADILSDKIDRAFKADEPAKLRKLVGNMVDARLISPAEAAPYLH